MSAASNAAAGNASSHTMLGVEDVVARWRLNVKTVYSMIDRGELVSWHPERARQIQIGGSSRCSDGVAPS